MTSSPTDPEKQQVAFANHGTASPQKRPGHPPRHFGHEAQAKLRHFLHPDGKRIHVAQSPEEALRLRSKLARLHPADAFDVYISGTPEHLAAIRLARQHHEARRAELHAQHKDIYERFADVHAELDSLSHELERVTTHGVSLEAHFSRFGYDAHVKSYEEEESPTQSGASTPRSSVSGQRRGSGEQESDYGSSLKLWKKPVVRQYFHKGILWRASRSEEVQSFELFVDLLYVGILAINGDAVSGDPTGQALLYFVVTFTVSWKVWGDMSQIVSWFETDDIVQRVSIIFLLGCLFGLTTNITQAFGEHRTYPTLIGFYLASRLFNAAYLAFIAIILPMVRGVVLCHVCNALIGSALWIASIHVSYPNRLILIWLALLADILGPILVISLKAVSHKFGVTAKERFDQMFEFWPAINIEHRTERQNAFVTLVFGYTVVAMLYQSTVNGIDGFFGKAILGLIQAFCFNWMYFDIDGANLHFHAIRRHKISAVIWSMAHLPFIMAFVLGGGALARLVVATDTSTLKLEHLTPTYQVRSEPVIRQGIRWFYCGGFGIALACMGVISLSHVHKEVETLRLKKRYRIAWRFCIAAILVCLPLAEHLDSLQLVGTVTALIVFALATELWAVSCCKEKWTGRSRPARYTGMCPKNKIRAILRDGREVDVGDLVSNNGSQDGLIVGP
ncbi:hypothetical protein B0A55_04073 [Friedmanniomyces simplex]|uniref:Uncharacterized protein n=1 Tax=Friedmanniomyces simplex TaxID=329884 RepID=A0A4V5NHM6_9PEZI|nr:hypothetical protein B0A55_04073 [Friedmanniomyces simplex]